MALPNTTFTGYSPDRMRQLAQSYGYNDANLAGFGKFLEANPARAKQYFDQQNMDMFGGERMRQFQQGGQVTKFGQAGGGPTPYGFVGPSGSATGALVDWYNPWTRESFTAPTGGWTNPDPNWVQGLGFPQHELDRIKEAGEGDDEARTAAENEMHAFTTQWHRDQIRAEEVRRRNPDPRVEVEQQQPVQQQQQPVQQQPPPVPQPHQQPQQQQIGQQQQPQHAGPVGFTPPATADPTQPIFDPDPVSYYNPTTKQVWTSPTGGWTAPTGWIEGAIPSQWESYYQPWMPTQPVQPDVPKIGTATADRIQQPQLPIGAAFEAPMIPFTQEQLIREGAGQVDRLSGQITDVAQVTAAQQAVPDTAAAAQMNIERYSPALQNLAFQAAQQQTPSQLVAAEIANQTTVSNLEAAQLGQATQIQSPAKRALETGELVSSAVGQAVQAAEWIEPIAEAATATPSTSATVQGQLATLMLQFEQNPDTPIWARGAVRLAHQEMAKRGLGASSMAGQAIVEAAMEKAIVIAQVDAQVMATFEKENLSNRQAMATLRAQQRAAFMNQEFDQEFKTRVQNAARISDIADRNFTAEQQIALENAKLAQTVDLENLSNTQALVIANATALADLDTTSLNNRQKAAVENASNFMQLDMGTMTNLQQGQKIMYEKIAESLLTDAAQQNVANKINITEQNQMDKFYNELIAGINQGNVGATNAMNQDNAGALNAANRQNSEHIIKVDMYNGANQLNNETSNVVWRRDIATQDTAGINFQNQFNAKNILDISQQAYDNLWQEYRDVMDMAWQSGESEHDRIQALQIIAAESRNDQLVSQYQADRENSAGIGGWLGDIFAPFAKRGVERLLGMPW